MSVQVPINWSDCSLVEIKPGVLSGAPVLSGTRMPVDAMLDNFAYGVSLAEIAEQFEVPLDHIRTIVTQAGNHRVAHSCRNWTPENGTPFFRSGTQG